MASKTPKDISKLDLYAILGVIHTATEKEILKAYRKKALKCHPDKNPDNPKAVEEFHQLSDALELLTDETTRAAYDKVLKAKKAAELRNQVLDSKRKKLKEDLEARERKAAEDVQSQQDYRNAQTLAEQVERLRKQGSKLLEAEQERLREELAAEKEAKEEAEDVTSAGAPRLKVKWKAKKGDSENGGYSEEVLHSLLSKYGDVATLLLSSKKKGSAIVEFASAHAAASAVEHEVGLEANPLTLSWISGRPEVTRAEPVSTANHTQDSATSATHNTYQQGDGGVESDRDFESIVLMRMRQAAERQKLIQQMQEEEENT